MMFYFKNHKPQHPPQCVGNAVTVHLFIEWKKEDEQGNSLSLQKEKKFLLRLELKGKGNYFLVMG